MLQDYTKKPHVPLAARREQAKQNRLSLPNRPHHHNSYNDEGYEEEDYGQDGDDYADDDYKDDYDNGYDNGYDEDQETEQRDQRRSPDTRAENQTSAGTGASPPASPTTGRVSMLQSAAAGVPGVHDPSGPLGGPLTSPIVPLGGKLLSAAVAPPSMQAMMNGGSNQHNHNSNGNGGGGGSGSGGNGRSRNPMMNRSQDNNISTKNRALTVLPGRNQSFGAKRITPFDEQTSQATQGPTTPAQFFAQLASKVR